MQAKPIKKSIWGAKMIKKSRFDVYDNQPVYLYELFGDGITVGITDFGARIQYIKLNTSNGVRDVCLGNATTEDYVKYNTYFGATVGRCANRIANGEFELNGKRYKLNCNDGSNHLHGGFVGFDKRFFTAEVQGERLSLFLFSKDGDEGYPGNLQLKVVYSLQGRELLVEYFATSDEDTLWNPTNHTFFNLDGENSGVVYGNMLTLNADYFTPCDEKLIPTGEILPVIGTPFDFTSAKRFGDGILSNDERITQLGGIDHNFILRSEHAATVQSSSRDISMDIYTDLPALQLYTTNSLANFVGKSGATYGKHHAFCLEPQYCPNAINIPAFSAPILKRNTHTSHYIRYVFTF